MMAPRPGEVLRSLAFYAVFYAGSVAYVLAGSAALPLCKSAFRRIVDHWSLFHRRCVECILGITVELQGSIPRQGALVAIKHESFFEAIDLPVLIDFPAVFAKVELLRLPLWGRLAAAYGMVAVERDQGARALRAMISAAKVRQEQGRTLVIFPEGTRVPHGEWAPIQSGFAGLYKLLGQPVVPVAVNSGPLYHRWWKRKGTITIRVGEPIPPGLSRQEVESRVKQAINLLND